MTRCVLTRKKQLARRGGDWNVVEDDYYLNSDQSDSKEEECANDEDADKYMLGDILEELD